MEKTDKKIAIVTGGSRGIGRAIVCHLAHECGFEVYFTYANSEATALSLETAIRNDEGIAHAHKVDGRDRIAVGAFVQYVFIERGRIDVLVNNAAITKDKLLALMTDEDWSSVVDTSLNGLFAMTRPVAKAMMRAKSGRIVNITSVSGVVGIAGQTNYSTAKAGIIGFTRSLSKELAPYGIPVNALAPGFVDTDMLSYMSEAQRKEATARVPMKRFGTADEIAQVVSYLATKAPAFLTGQTIVVDGGMTA
jgi:3-oxoacyl-[acyl-carrier protein] reductase